MEPLKHNCGVALVRLLRPAEYYQEKYGTAHYGLDKLYLLMEKQHNRGQEGAGVACVKLHAAPGEEYMFRERALGPSAIGEIFNTIGERTREKHFLGELYMGHLRYSTTGRSGLDYIHPFLRRNNWRAKNLALCGNFNLTNVDEVFRHIVADGQHPRKYADTHIMLEQVGHRLDREAERLYNECKAEGMTGTELTYAIEDRMDMGRVLSSSSPLWDGGYVMCGVTGSGEMFAIRDPWGIRTAFWYMDDEVMVLASERPVIETTLNITAEQVHELEPGQTIVVRKSGKMELRQTNKPQEKRACSFERIYFSRGSDMDIYRERKELGRRLVSQILPAIDHDIEHTVISYIPNTAEVAYYGLLEGMDFYLNDLKAKGAVPMHTRIRSEKVAIKDIKLRTFIAEGNSRNDLAAHVYDITYGSLEPYSDNLVIIDDSIVRGTTLKQSIIRILDRLHPRRTVIVSSAPQVRYPDYYGIDMSSLDQFVAFKAAITLLHEKHMDNVIDDVYARCQDADSEENPVKDIYAPFTDEEVSGMIARLLTPDDVGTEVKIIFQSVDGLHHACPNHRGDWYFTGDYPTIGGLRMLKKTFIEYYESMKKPKTCD